jgi:hypothetical protein
VPGLLLVAGFLVFLCFGGYLIGIPALTLAAPGLVPYLYLTDPAQFEAHREAWLAALAAAPVIATLPPPGWTPTPSGNWTWSAASTRARPT